MLLVPRIRQRESADLAWIAGTNASGVGTAVPQPWFPLMTCTDKALNLSCPQAGDLIWNAYKDVTAQLNTDSQCKSKAQNLVFSKFTGGDANGYPITSVSFVSYISHQPGFYDGTKSTTPLGFALCGEGSFSFQLHHRANCNGAWGVTIKDDFSNLTNTVDTVTPSYPFKSFWRPSYTPPAPGQIFGIGIDPSNNGVNISNESNFFHEALHGMTGLYDDQIQSTLGIPVSSDTSNISLYIRDNVLSQCPTFR